jgi:hypothetical protein
MIAFFANWTPVLTMIVSLPFSTVDSPRFEFVEETGTLVGLQRGDDLLIGRLDFAGNFVQDLRWKDVKMKDRIQPFSYLPWVQVINSRRPHLEDVYEFRSGRLIKGELDKDGNFIPDLGSKVIDFKDYQYKKDSLYIYNLPGYFREKKANAK